MRTQPFVVHLCTKHHTGAKPLIQNNDLRTPGWKHLLKHKYQPCGQQQQPRVKTFKQVYNLFPPISIVALTLSHSHTPTAVGLNVESTYSSKNISHVKKTNIVLLKLLPASRQPFPVVWRRPPRTRATSRQENCEPTLSTHTWSVAAVCPCRLSWASEAGRKHRKPTSTTVKYFLTKATACLKLHAGIAHRVAPTTGTE